MRPSEHSSEHTHTDAFVWRSQDERFGLRIPVGMLAQVRHWCQQSGRDETGGILVGHYTVALDCAVITTVQPAPRDSRRGRAWFERGTLGLQLWLDDMWSEQREYYLGEWHYHPHAIPAPSPTDREQMRRIARTPSACCPEPVLLIVGGDPDREWQAQAFVFPANAHVAPLLEIDVHAPPEVPTLPG